MKPSDTARALWLARAYYFFFFGAVGCYFPYINVYYANVGLSGAAIGVLAAVGPVSLMVIGPLWGGLGDRFRLHRILLPLATFAPIVPTVLVGSTARLGPLLLLITLGSIFFTAISPLIDSAVLELIEGTYYAFGDVRVWGSIGYMLCTIVCGYLIEWQGSIWIFIGYAVNMALAGLAALGLPARRRALRVSFGAGLRQLLAQRSFALFLGGVGLLGAAVYACLSFFPIYLRQLGGGEALIGLAGAIAAVSEMPTLFYSRWVLDRIGAWGAAALGALTYGVRWGLLAIIVSPGLALLTQALHSLSFGAFLIGGVAFVDQHTPSGLGATAQAVFTATVYGVGASLGALAGGWLYDRLGASGFFLAASLTTFMGLLLIVAARRPPQAQPTPL
jgi:PPP family 3-phenylpropionic acid transporter